MKQLTTTHIRTTTIRRKHRLPAPGVVEDRQPPLHQRDIHRRTIAPHTPITEPPTPIGPALGDARVQRIEPRLGDRHTRRPHPRVATGAHTQDAGYAAHKDGPKGEGRGISKIQSSARTATA
jgi:hypothetical protein